MSRPILRLPNVIVLLSLLACATHAAGPRLHYGEPIPYDDRAPKVLPDFTLRYTGYTPHVVHVGGDSGRDFDFGTDDFEMRRGDEVVLVHWSQGTGVIAPTFFTVAGNAFVLELLFTEVKPSSTDSRIAPGSLLIWKRADFERRVKQMSR